MENRIPKIGIILLFSMIIFGGFIGSFVKKDREFSVMENRYLAENPPFDKGEFLAGDWQEYYENYLNDQFLFRDQWITMKTAADRVMLKQDSGDVYYGKDGYLIEKYESVDFDQSLIEDNIGFLCDFIKDMQKQYGKDHVLAMVVPGKANAIPKKLPAFASPYNEKEIVEQITSQLGKESVLDVTKELQHHQSEYIYYRTDHHWTSLGAWYAYQQWANKVGETPVTKEECHIEPVTNEFFGTTYFKVHAPVPGDTIDLYHTPAEDRLTVRFNLSEEKNSMYDRKALKEQDKYKIFFGGNQPLIELEREDKKKGTLLLVKDSYANSFVPFLTNHYSKIIMIDVRYLNSSIYSFIDMYKKEITEVMTMYNVEKFLQEKNMWNLAKELD